ncbi:MAG: hypothetical protein HS132_00085 [Planctomycetia bacterium]|nr:hypothetical protein [Planctomycetia bacterium]
MSSKSKTVIYDTPNPNWKNKFVERYFTFCKKSVYYFLSVFPKIISKLILKLWNNSEFVLGYAIRHACLKRLGMKIGDAYIRPFVTIWNPHNITVGDRVTINETALIVAGRYAHIIIGSDVLIAHGVCVLT